MKKIIVMMVAIVSAIASATTAPTPTVAKPAVVKPAAPAPVVAKPAVVKPAAPAPVVAKPAVMVKAPTFLEVYTFMYNVASNTAATATNDVAAKKARKDKEQFEEKIRAAKESGMGEFSLEAMVYVVQQRTMRGQELYTKDRNWIFTDWTAMGLNQSVLEAIKAMPNDKEACDAYFNWAKGKHDAGQ